MIYILILFIIILFYYINKNIVIENYIQQEEEQKYPVIYSKNVCGKPGDECSIINYNKNTCCDGLYCIRPKGDFYNKICSKTPDKSKEPSTIFKNNIIKITNYIKGFGRNMYLNIDNVNCIKEQQEEEEEENNGTYKYNIKNL